jgi:hypothetical protein
MTQAIDARGLLLRAALGFLALEPREPELHLLHRGPHLSPRPPLHPLPVRLLDLTHKLPSLSRGERITRPDDVH